MTDSKVELKVSTDLEGFEDQGSADIEEKLQHVADLAQQRADRAAERAAAKNPEPEPEPETRLSIRERLVQQTQSSRPSVQRRNRQHPRRAASFHTGDTNVQIANDIQNFREAFESARSNIFCTTSPGVGEVTPAFPAIRRNLDIPANRDNSAPSSGSSTPRILRRAESEAARTQALDDPFASVLSELGISTGFGSNPNVSDSGRRNGSRSSSATREGRGATTTNYQRFVMTNPAEIARSSSRNGRNETRRSRMPERRRRTIGVETADVREAMALTSAGSHERINQISSSETRPSTHDNISLTRDSFQYSSYRPLYQRKIEINEATTRPILALNDETVVYLDNKGHCHWLEKTHPLLKAVKENSQPAVTVSYKQEIAVRNDEEKDSVTDIPGDPEERINKIRELIENSKNREGSCINGYTPNQINDENNDNALDEIDARIMNKKRKKLGIDPAYTIEAIEEQFKHESYYTKPRARPDINTYKLMRKYKSIYDYEGSDRSEDISGDGNHVTRPGTLNLNDNVSNSTGNGLHITVTDTAERVDNMRISVSQSVITSSGSMTESANAGNDMRGDTNRTDSVNRSYSGLRSDTFSRPDTGYRSPSNALHRSASVQDYTATSSGPGETPTTPTSRLVRHGSLESTFSRYSGQSSSRNNNTNDNIHEEVESLINRLQQRHAYAEIPIDTSHLDIEEMRMIQKALEENPSPPPSLSDFEAEEVGENMVSENLGNITIETDDSSNVTLKPVDNGGDIDGMTEFGPLSPVQEDTHEAESPCAETNKDDSLHTVFDEFVSTVNEERTLNLPRGHIFSNR